MKRIMISRATVQELDKFFEPFTSNEQTAIMGGGTGSISDPYSMEQYQSMGDNFISGWVLDGIDGPSYYDMPYACLLDSFYSSSNYEGSSIYENSNYYNSYVYGNSDEYVSVLEENGFSGFDPNDRQGCFRRCLEMLSFAGCSLSNNRITMVENNNGTAGVATVFFSDGISAIDNSLNNGNPIIVGVDDGSSNSYNEGLTDHFIIITGYTINDSGIKEYSFFDPRTSNVNKGTRGNALSVINGKLVGSFQNGTINYTVTQVRINN